MLAGDLVAPIEQFAPVCMQEKWDNCGFVVGDASLDVSKALSVLFGIWCRRYAESAFKKAKTW